MARLTTEDPMLIHTLSRSERHARDVESRLAEVERRLDRANILSRVLATALCGLLAATLVPSDGVGRFDDLEARSLSLVDEAGNPRIVLGAPIPEPPERSQGPAFGMNVLDEHGHERFRLVHDSKERTSLSFSAAVGVGDQRDRERLIIGLHPAGQGYVRFQDNRGRPSLYLRNDRDDAAWAEFVRWSEEDPYVSLGAMRYGLQAAFGERSR